MHLLTVAALLLIGFVVDCCCESYFIMPANYDQSEDNDAQNPRYKVGENIKIRWLTDQDATMLEVIQQDPTNSSSVLWATIEENTTDKTSVWTISFDDFDDNTSGQDALFWFELYEVGASLDDDALAISRTFNVSQTSSSTTTSAVSDPTSSETESDSSSDSSLSAGAGAGIAVGATLGALLLFGGLGFIAWKRFRKGKQPEYQPPPENQSPMAYQPSVAYQSPVPQVAYQQQQPYEPKTELPTSTANQQSNVYEAP